MGILQEWRKPRIEQASPRNGVRFKWPFDVLDTPTGASTTISSSLAGLFSQGLAGGQAYEFMYQTQSAVYTVVEFLATQIAGVGLKVYRRVDDTDREEVRTGALFDLLHEPAPGLTYTAWMHQWVADRCIFGNAYQQKVGTGSGKMLVPLPPPRVTPRGGNLLSAGSYDFRNSQGAPTNIPADEVIHSRRYNPYDPRIGVSPLEPLRVILRSDAAALAHMENVWLNGARAGGWIKLPDELSDDAMERLRSSVKNVNTGAANAGKVGFLEGGADFVEGSWDPGEARFIEGRKLTLETVARAYNVPLPVLSLTDTATFASQKEFHKALYTDTLGPWFTLIEEEIERFILPWIGAPADTYVQFNVKEKLRGDFAEESAALRQAVGVPTLSVNEGRALQDKPRIDDEDFDLPVKPSNVVYGDAQAPGEAPMPQERGEGLRAVPGGSA